MIPTRLFGKTELCASIASVLHLDARVVIRAFSAIAPRPVALVKQLALYDILAGYQLIDRLAPAEEREAAREAFGSNRVAPFYQSAAGELSDFLGRTVYLAPSGEPVVLKRIFAEDGEAEIGEHGQTRRVPIFSLSGEAVQL
ncbi:MAG TPA: hypothetical protein VIT91_20980 [Chthoniobacterales bacterium]